MWILAVVVAIVVLGLAAFAGLGRLGQMPPDAVTDRPKGRIPAGPVTAQFLAEARLPTAGTGYDRSQVDHYLARVVDGTAPPAAETVFDVVRGGYDMQVVDEVLLRVDYERPTAAPPPEDTPPTEDTKFPG